MNMTMMVRDTSPLKNLKTLCCLQKEIC